MEIEEDTPDGRALACLQQGCAVDFAIAHFRNVTYKSPDRVEALLKEDVLNYVLPLISVEDNAEAPFCYRNVQFSLTIAIRLAKFEQLPDSPLQNPDFCRNLVLFISDSDRLPVKPMQSFELQCLVLRLSRLMLNDSAIQRPVYTAFMENRFIGVIFDSPIFSALEDCVSGFTTVLRAISVLKEMSLLVETNFLDLFSPCIPILLQLLTFTDIPAEKDRLRPNLTKGRVVASDFLSILFRHIINRQIAYNNNFFEKLMWCLQFTDKREGTRGFLFDCVTEMIENDGMPDALDGPGFYNLMRNALFEANSTTLTPTLRAIESMFETRWDVLWDTKIIKDIRDGLKHGRFEYKAAYMDCLMRFCRFASPEVLGRLIGKGMIDLFASNALCLGEEQQREFIDLLFFFVNGDQWAVDALRESEALSEALDDLAGIESESVSVRASELIQCLFSEPEPEFPAWQ
jgi:hypothetical protein